MARLTRLLVSPCKRSREKRRKNARDDFLLLNHAIQPPLLPKNEGDYRGGKSAGVSSRIFPEKFLSYIPLLLVPYSASKRASKIGGGGWNLCLSTFPLLSRVSHIFPPKRGKILLTPSRQVTLPPFPQNNLSKFLISKYIFLSVCLSQYFPCSALSRTMRQKYEGYEKKEKSRDLENMKGRKRRGKKIKLSL